MKLNTRQKYYLKGRAHSLKPIVMLGNHGLTEGVLAEIEQALTHHELIKLKLAVDNRENRRQIIDTILHETKADEIQTIGKNLTLYRPSAEQRVALPRK